MTPIEKLVRPARIEDADVLAELVSPSVQFVTACPRTAAPPWEPMVRGLSPGGESQERTRL